MPQEEEGLINIPEEKKRDTEIISVHLPASLMREIRILLLDPVYGKIKYGQLTHLITALLAEWLEKKRKKLETVGSDIPPADRFEVFSDEGL